MAVHPPIVPKCRYNHGDLMRVTQGGRFPEWSLFGGRTIYPVGTSFSVALYVCRTCGYIELFDTDVELTIQQESPPSQSESK